MFDILLTCSVDELYGYAKEIAESIDSEKMAEDFIRTLFKRVPELTDLQEKELHKIGRKVRKKFGMKPIHID